MRTRCNQMGMGVFLVFLLVQGAMAGELITAVSVRGFGEYGNDVNVLIDGTMPPEETEYTDPACVYWDTPKTSFIVDLGTAVLIEGITLQVDNNDDYRVAVSRDGKTYEPLLLMSGEWGGKDFGMETLSTLSGDPEHAPEASLSPVLARYLKLTAEEGDGAYAMSEVLVYGKRDVPEASTAPVAGKDGKGMGQAFDSMDADHDGKVSLDEYAARWKGKLDVPSNFAFFDKDGSGFIDRGEYVGLSESETKEK